MGIVKKYTCLCCGVTVEKANTAGKYCSNKCQLTHQFNQRVDAWVNNNEKIGKTIAKRYLVDHHGDKCSVCGITDWNGESLVLEIDHTDGDAYNNRPENLRLICPNCHSQTPTYKNRNKGNGRKLNAKETWLLL